MSEDPRKEEKNPPILFPWLAKTARVGTTWHKILFAPEGRLLRMAFGAALSVNVAAGAAFVWQKTRPAEAGWSSPFSDAAASAPPGHFSGSAGIPRPSMESLIAGAKTILGAGGDLSDSPLGEGIDGKAPEDAAAGDASAEAKAAAEKAAAEQAAAAQANAEKNSNGGPAAGAGQGGIDAGAAAGGGGSGASLAARGGGIPSSGGTSASMAAAPAGAGGGAASGREKSAARGAKSISTSKGGGKGALNQLKFAQDRSKLGAQAGRAEPGYRAASDAFEGQTIAGAGPAEGGAGTGAGPMPVDTIPPGPGAQYAEGPMESPQSMTCPAGYALRGEQCAPIDGKNKTPWQGLLDMAKVMLIAAAIMALIGLLLLWKGPKPWGDVIGGMLLGAAAALVVAALAIGMQVRNKYGQKKQGDAVDAAGAGAMKGEAPK